MWLKLQGECRKKYGSSKEMKVGIAYDGVLYQRQKGGKTRRTLDNKVAFASFEPSKDFRRHHEAIIASVYNTDEIELRVKNGDGANWIQKTDDCECICVLDEFHRNKKLTECVTDKEKAQTLCELLLTKRIDDLMDCLEAYINSSENEQEKAKLLQRKSGSAAGILRQRDQNTRNKATGRRSSRKARQYGKQCIHTYRQSHEGTQSVLEHKWGEQPCRTALQSSQYRRSRSCCVKEICT